MMMIGIQPLGLGYKLLRENLTLLYMLDING